MTFLTGDNGTGKSPLVEAIAVALGIHPEGGSRSFRFATRPSESELGSCLRLTRCARRPITEYFLRAESFYNVATEAEALERVDPGLLASSYGGRSLHQRSHGESFLALVLHRFGPKGLYLLDEPESALSVNGCLAAMLDRAADTAVRLGRKLGSSNLGPATCGLEISAARSTTRRTASGTRPGPWSPGWLPDARRVPARGRVTSLA